MIVTFDENVQERDCAVLFELNGEFDICVTVIEVVQSRSWTLSSNVTITLSQHLFTERRPLPACTQNGTPSHPGNTK